MCCSMINYLLMGSHTGPPIATNDQLTLYGSNQDPAQPSFIRAPPPLSVSKSDPNCELGRYQGFISELSLSPPRPGLVLTSLINWG